MITLVGLIFLVALYLSFVFSEGLLYQSSLTALDWLDQEHGNRGLLGWASLISLVAAYLFYLEKSDNRKEEARINELITVIKESGAYSKKTENNGFGDVHLIAAITFKESGFVMQVKQCPANGPPVTLVDKKFLSWKELNLYLKSENKFAWQDFVAISNRNYNPTSA